jgi:hypothetical protein
MNFRPKSKFIVLISVIILIIAFSTYKYIYKPHENIEDRKIDYKGTANNFLSKITDEEVTSWLNKTIQLNGKITSLDSKGILFNNNIYCQFKESSEIKLLQKDQDITIKGIVIGYDDLLEELKLNQCIIKQ